MIDSEESSPAPMLDYHRPDRRRPWIERFFIRFLLIGPVAGGVIGAIQTATSMVGRAHSYFAQSNYPTRNWNALLWQLKFEMVAGACVGVPAGLVVVYGMEEGLKRRIPIWHLLGFLFVMAGVVFGISNHLENLDKSGRLLALLLSHLVVVSVGMVAALVSSRPMPTDP